MNMKEFMTAYTENMVASMRKHEISLYSISLDCKHCPFYDICHADDAEDMGCADFIAQHISDIKEYRVH